MVEWPLFCPAPPRFIALAAALEEEALPLPPLPPPPPPPPLRGTLGGATADWAPLALNPPAGGAEEGAAPMRALAAVLLLAPAAVEVVLPRVELVAEKFSAHPSSPPPPHAKSSAARPVLMWVEEEEEEEEEDGFRG